MADLLQPSLQGDRRMENLAALIARLSALPVDVPLVNLFDLVDASALPALAEQFHILGAEGWNLALEEADRRALLKKSIEMHRRKGTPWAVEEALRSAGFAGSSVREGAGLLRHNGEAAHNGASLYESGTRWALFDVIIDLGERAGLSARSREQLKECVNAWKNARSHLRAIAYAVSVRDNVNTADELECQIAGQTSAETAFRGFPLHNGEIFYNNAAPLRHSGAISHNGQMAHTGYALAGHAHNNGRERFATHTRAAMTDSITPQEGFALTIRRV